MDLNKFFEKEYPAFAAYDLIRKIGNYIDGQKNASRKVLHTVIEQNIDKFMKVSNLAPKVQDYTQYLHGSIDGIVVNMAKPYIGSNNFPLLEGDGNFGTRFIPEPAASRYIFARKSKYVNEFFKKEDLDIVPEQYFEGHRIEPKYFVPILPVILLNGSDGVSIGYAQTILPRDPKAILKYISNKLKGKPSNDKLPIWFRNTDFIINTEGLKTTFTGRFERLSKTKIQVNSLPPGITLKKYQETLEKLIEKGVIKNYEDLSDNDVFKFIISVTREFGSLPDEIIINKLKLSKSVTENFTVIDENNRIRVFSSAEELLDAWIDIRLQYNEKRKQKILKDLKEQIKFIEYKYKFIKTIIDKKLYTEPEEVWHDTFINDIGIPEAIYKKLMQVPIRSISKTDIGKLLEKKKELQEEYNTVKEKTETSILLDDLSTVNLD